MRAMVWLAVLAVGGGVSAAFADEKIASSGAEMPSVSAIVKERATFDVTPPASADATEKSEVRAEVEKPKPVVPEARAQNAPVGPSLIAKINLTSQRLEVIEGGATRHSWAISSGREEFPSPRGTYRVQWTAKMWHSRKYDMAPMPHAVFFTGGVAVHATSAVGQLGRPASHGCIRLAPGHAALFYSLVQKHGNARTQIQVFGSPPSSAIASRRERTPVDRIARADFIGGQGLGPSRNGMVHLAPGSRYAGSASFTHNGIRYVRVR